MNNLLSNLGLGDGQGNISSTRIVMVLITLAVLIPKVYLACKTGTAPTWSEGDFAMLGIAGGTKLINSHLENQTPKTP